MMKKIINLIDSSCFVNTDSWVAAAAACGTGERNHRQPEEVEYIRNQKDWGGITLFTDKDLSKVLEVNSHIKVGILMESWVLDPTSYRVAQAYEDHFDYIFTYNPDLLAKNPEKYKFFPADTICIDQDSMVIGSKTNMVSMTYSNKHFLPGHKRRHHTVNNVLPRTKQQVDLYGSGSKNSLKYKSDALNTYRFSIEIENAYLPNYFTEKLLDCFATGTIPIYWGLPNVGDYFNPEGVLSFTDDDSLLELLDNLSIDLYNEKLSAVEENYKTAMSSYLQPDDNIYKKVMNYERNKV